MTTDPRPAVAPGFEPVRERSRRTSSATITVAKSAPRSRSSRRAMRRRPVGRAHRCRGTQPGATTRSSTCTRRRRASSPLALPCSSIAACCATRTRVASVWPEFAQNGKQHVTIAQVLSHQAGLPAFEDPTTLEDLYDWHGALRGTGASEATLDAGREDRLSPDHLRLPRRRDRASCERPSQHRRVPCRRSSRHRCEAISSSASSPRCIGASPRRCRRRT